MLKFSNMVFTLFIGLALSCLLITASAAAQPTSFKKIGNGNSASIVIQNCALVDGVNKVKITNGGKSVSVFTLKNRDEYDFDKKYKFFACQDGIIYAKSLETDTPTTFDLSLDDFPKVENSVGSACSTVKSWPGSHIYKTVGSHHFTDIRRNTIGLILKIGASGPFPSCIDAIDSKGKSVAKLSLYARGAGWAARYYAGIGCGSGTPLDGGDVSRKAQSNTGSKNIYMDFGSVCYGPIDASKCVGSKAC